MENKYLGSCLCGAVKYEVSGGEFENFFLCHCKYCQKDTGSAHSANLFSTKAKLNWLSGQEKVKTYNLPGTRHTKNFCEICSSAMPSVQMNGAFVQVPAGSLDSGLAIRPQGHLFCSSRADWDDNLESVRKFEKLPS